MKLNISKTKVISFSRKTNVLIYDYKLCQSSITWTDSIKDMGVFTDAKLHFQDHVNYIFSHCAKLLGLVRNITFNFSYIECNPEGKRPLGRPRRRWVDNIKMDLRETGWDGGGWIDVAQDRDQWRALVRAVMNLRVP
jgi:hypothetical protein